MTIWLFKSQTKVALMLLCIKNDYLKTIHEILSNPRMFTEVSDMKEKEIF